MREVIRQFTKNLDMVSFLDENNSLCISELARMLSIPYSTAYVRIHKLEEAGLVQLEYLSGKKTVKLTETALELIDAMKTLESEE
ncbi:MAG: winged helix-turn-helix domain-containing protein [Archaeoglobaceae archaeon]